MVCKLLLGILEGCDVIPSNASTIYRSYCSYSRINGTEPHLFEKVADNRFEGMYRKVHTYRQAEAQAKFSSVCLYPLSI